jgi:GTP-binding protein
MLIFVFSSLMLLVIGVTRPKYFLVGRKNRKGVVILVNKWDLVERKPRQLRDLRRENQASINAVYGCAYSFVSALTKQRPKSIRSYGKVYETDSSVS